MFSKGGFRTIRYVSPLHSDHSATRDKSLATFCEEVVQVLIDMKAPGCQWLDLAPLDVVSLQ